MSKIQFILCTPDACEKLEAESIAEILKAHDPTTVFLGDEAAQKDFKTAIEKMGDKFGIVTVSQEGDKYVFGEKDLADEPHTYYEFPLDEDTYICLKDLLAVDKSGGPKKGKKEPKTEKKEKKSEPSSAGNSDALTKGKEIKGTLNGYNDMIRPNLIDQTLSLKEDSDFAGLLENASDNEADSTPPINDALKELADAIGEDKDTYKEAVAIGDQGKAMLAALSSSVKGYRQHLDVKKLWHDSSQALPKALESLDSAVQVDAYNAFIAQIDSLEQKDMEENIQKSLTALDGQPGSDDAIRFLQGWLDSGNECYEHLQAWGKLFKASMDMKAELQDIPENFEPEEVTADYMKPVKKANEQIAALSTECDTIFASIKAMQIKKTFQADIKASKDAADNRMKALNKQFGINDAARAEREKLLDEDKLSAKDLETRIKNEMSNLETAQKTIQASISAKSGPSAHSKTLSVQADEICNLLARANSTKISLDGITDRQKDNDVIQGLHSSCSSHMRTMRKKALECLKLVAREVIEGKKATLEAVEEADKVRKAGTNKEAWTAIKNVETPAHFVWNVTQTVLKLCKIEFPGLPKEGDKVAMLERAEEIATNCTGVSNEMMAKVREINQSWLKPVPWVPLPVTIAGVVAAVLVIVGLARYWWFMG